MKNLRLYNSIVMSVEIRFKRNIWEMEDLRDRIWGIVFLLSVKLFQDVSFCLLSFRLEPCSLTFTPSSFTKNMSPLRGFILMGRDFFAPKEFGGYQYIIPMGLILRYLPFNIQNSAFPVRCG